MSVYDRETYLWYKQMGICTDCRKERAAPGRTRCEECAAKQAERAQVRRERMTQEEKKDYSRRQNSSAVKRMKVRAESGRCAFCGRPYPEATPFGQCRECRNKRNRSLREKREANGIIPRSEWPSYGMCYRCGAPIEEGSLCERCIRQNSAASRAGSWHEFTKAEINRCFAAKRNEG